MREQDAAAAMLASTAETTMHAALPVRTYGRTDLELPYLPGENSASVTRGRTYEISPSPLPPALVARMSWPARRQLARRRHAELLAAAAEHYAHYPDSRDSLDLLFEHWTPINKPLQLPTNIDRPALSVYRMLNDEATAASHVKALLNAEEPGGPCPCDHCSRHRRNRVRAADERKAS